MDYARHADASGAAAISSVPPFYWKFKKDEIVSYYRDVSESVSIPMIVYNIALAGLVDFNTIKELAAIENVKGIKYTATTHNEILRIKDEVGEDFKVYSGADEMALSGLIYGSDGIIGSFYNIIPELFILLEKAVEDGDIASARLMQKKANAVIYYVLENHFFDTLKAVLKWSGICDSTVLSPFYRLTEDDEIRIRRELKELCRFHVHLFVSLDEFASYSYTPGFPVAVHDGKYIKCCLPRHAFTLRFSIPNCFYSFQELIFKSC